MIVDVHCHVHADAFDVDREQLLAEAAAAGVGVALAMGEGETDNARVLAVADEARGAALRVLPCLGLHPERAGSDALERVVAQIRGHAARIAAVGEVGLDFWIAKEEAERDRQREVLVAMAALARELDLPLSVHSRSAGHQAIELLLAAGAERVCMHAFDGAAKHAVAAVARGYFFSVPPSVVRSPQKQKLVRRLPLAALLLETDAPVLGPDPQRRNTPRNALLAAQAVAELQGRALDEVIAVTSANARQLFRLDRLLPASAG